MQCPMSNAPGPVSTVSCVLCLRQHTNQDGRHQTALVLVSTLFVSWKKKLLSDYMCLYVCGGVCACMSMVVSVSVCLWWCLCKCWCHSLCLCILSKVQVLKISCVIACVRHTSWRRHTIEKFLYPLPRLVSGGGASESKSHCSRFCRSLSAGAGGWDTLSSDSNMPKSS